MSLFRIILLLFISAPIFSQELICNLLVNSDQIQGSNKSVFNTLQKSASEFLNNRKWSEMSFTQQEKIECTFNIIIKKVDGDSYTAELQVQARRPVYNSGYFTTIFNFRDNDFVFSYQENEVLEFNENVISSNLTAVLTYYAYIIIGYDLDSFSRLGGSSFFQAAENLVNAAQSLDTPGWQAFKSNKNRYALVNNLTDEAFKKYRNYFYEYHRLGLDEMTANVVNARAKMLEGLPILREANRARPSAIVISTFLDTKRDEMINVFKNASEKEKKTAVEVLSDVNPTMSNRYETILN